MKNNTLFLNLRTWRGLFLFTLVLSTIYAFSPKHRVIAASNQFHTTKELSFFSMLLDSLPTGHNSLFAASGECVECHGLDTTGFASTDILGNDINVVDDWRATMMANSAKDPFWRAKVSHEVAVFPEHQAEIEASCTDCHAPLGHFAAFHNGAESYSIAEMAADSIALDGVSCLACHQQSTLNLGNTHSGNLHFDTTQVAYGPFVSPLSSPMLEATGYEPVYSEHINDAGICAACHTLITETIDDEGQLTGGSFVEQATYHEWLNSDYEAENTSCQECHMPTLSKGQFYLAAGYQTPPRDRFALHEFAGANVNMLKILRDHADELDIAASVQDFENTIAATEKMLQQRTLDVELIDLERTTDTLFVALKVRNKAGHKFPSGYPSRRAFVHLKVATAEQQTLFNSGQIGADYEVSGQNADYEPHYTTIRSEDEVQIYEQVMGDVNDQVTTTLTKAAYHIKDNRLPPRGFRTDHEVYDTTAIAGRALTDTDFNHDEDMQEGSGSDIVYYHIPLNGNTEELFVNAKVYYQSMPPKWMEEMFDYNTTEIDAFRAMYESADRTPTLVGADSLHYDQVVATHDVQQDWPIVIRALGNGELVLGVQEATELKVYTLLGQHVYSQSLRVGDNRLKLQHPQQMLVFQFERKGQQQSKVVWIP